MASIHMRIAFGGSLIAVLACGGVLPEDLGALELTTPPDQDPPVETDEVAPPDPEPPPPEAPASAESLFATLEVEEEPPSAPTCEKGSSVIRHPKGNLMHIYCANHAGKKQGLWTAWRGRTLVATRTYAEGSQEGRATTWSREAEGMRKRSESMFAGDVQQGDHAEWDADGTLRVRGAYADGKREGRFLEMTRDGDGPAVFAGVCYTAGEKSWETTDSAKFVADPCGVP